MVKPSQDQKLKTAFDDVFTFAEEELERFRKRLRHVFNKPEVR
ncbi:MAG: hypothetical protein SLRJCFUN_001178 [Candidatus Fervidibacter sp.]